MRTPNIGTIGYSPDDPPSEPAQLQRFLRDELRKISGSIQLLALGHLDKTNAAPAKPRDGDLRYADGSNWNPGYGAGTYIYIGSAWDRFATIAAGNAFKGRQTTNDGVTSGADRVIGGRATANVSASDTVTAVTSNGAFAAFAQTYSIPANTLKQGSVLKAKALVVVNDASGAVTLTCEMRIGGTSLIATTAVDPGATTDLHLLEFEFTARAAPAASASCVGAGRWITNTGGTIAHGTGLLAPTNFATNGALTLDVRAKWSVSNANTSARLEMLNVDIT